MFVSVAPLLKQPLGSEVAFAFAEDPIDPQGDNAALIEAGFESVDARVTATHTNPGPLLEGEARATTQQQCSRCLRPVKVLIDATFAEQYYATVGVVEKLDDNTCVLVTGADSIEIVAVYIGMLGIDFHVTEPPELVQHLALLGRRYARSVSTSNRSPLPESDGIRSVSAPREEVLDGEEGPPARCTHQWEVPDSEEDPPAG